jgi:hypothetical protein
MNWLRLGRNCMGFTDLLNNYQVAKEDSGSSSVLVGYFKIITVDYVLYSSRLRSDLGRGIHTEVLCGFP